MDESKKDDFKVYVQTIIKTALPNLGKGGYFFSTRGRKSNKKTEKTIARKFLELIITRDTETNLNNIDQITRVKYIKENGTKAFYTINALDILTSLVIIIFRRLRYGTPINRSEIRGRRVIPIFNTLVEPEQIVANDQRTQQEADEENEENKKEYTEYLKLLLENQNLLDPNIIYIQLNNVIYEVPGGLYVPIPQNIGEIERQGNLNIRRDRHSRILTNIIFYITRYMNRAGINITGNADAAIQNFIDITDTTIRTETDNIFNVARTETQTRSVKSARTNIVVNLEAAPPAPILPIEEEEEEEIKITGTIDENELMEQIINQAVNDPNMDRVTDLMLQRVPVQREEVKLEEPEIEEPPIRILADIKGGDLPIVPIGPNDRDIQNIFQKIEDEQNQNQPNQNEINRLRNLMRNFNRRTVLENFNLFMNEEIIGRLRNIARNLSMMNRGPQNLIHRDNVQAIMGNEQPNIPEIVNVAQEHREELVQYLNGQFGLNINDPLVYAIGQSFILSIFSAILFSLGIFKDPFYDYIHIPPESKLVEKRVQEENNGSLLFANYETILDIANNLFSQIDFGDDIIFNDEGTIFTNPYIPRTNIPEPTIISGPIISDDEIFEPRPFIVDSRARGLSYIANDAQIYINGKWYASKVDYLIPKPIIIDEKKEESQLAIIDLYEKPKFDFDRDLYKEIFEQSKLLFGMPNVTYYEPKQLINFFTNQEISFLSELITGDLEPKDIIKETIKIFKKPENIKLLKEYVFSMPDFKSGGGPPDDDPPDDDADGDFGDKIPDDDEVDYFINTANGFIYIVSSLTYFLMVPFKLIGLVGSVFATFKLILFMTIAILLIFFAYQVSGLTIPEFINFAFNLFLGTVQTAYDFGVAIVDGYKFVQSYLSVIPGGSYILPLVALLGIGYIVFSSSKISTIKFSLL